MKLLITLVVLSVFCAILTDAFLLGHKFKDGCDPDPCKHKAKCTLDAKNKTGFHCECVSDYAGPTCDKHVGCYSKPCKHGSCENLKNDLTLYHCTCEKGYVGEKCDTKDPCVTHSLFSSKDKPFCTGEGSVCHVDPKTLKAVCDCPTGFSGKKCDKRNCTIAEFKSHKNFAAKPKMYIDSEHMKKWTDLDGLAGLCNVKIQQNKTFVQQTNMSANKIEFKDFAFYTGRGLTFTILDKSGKNEICNTACLGKNPIQVKEAKCFMDGLQAIEWKTQPNVPGSIHDGSHVFKLLSGNTYSSKDYDLVRTFKQVGCKELKM